MKKKQLHQIIIASIVAVSLIILALILMPRHTHEYDEWEIYKNPTCTANGIDRRYCSCGEYQQKTINKIGHMESDWIINTSANQRYKECTECNEIIIIESLGTHTHYWSDWNTVKDASCLDSGSIARTCECGAEETLPISPKGHSFGDWTTTKEASCGTNGTQHRKCSSCDFEETKDIPALSHEEDAWVLVGSEKQYKCIHCNEILRVEIIEISTDLEISNGVVIGIGSCNDIDIEIPAYHNGLKVTDIADKAFYGNKTIVSVIMPNTLINIQNQAFYGCRKIKVIVLPNSVETIGERAFACCDSLETIHIEKSIKSIGELAFEYCTKLKDIYYNGTVEEWNSIFKSDDWDYKSGKYTIHCTNGTIIK